jgi:DNA mismatch endonuclease, patch repair protein
MTSKRERPKPYSKPDELRSRIMRSNKSHGNFSTELTLLHLLRSERVSGWRRGIVIPGRPDFVFKRERLAIFIDGCYWHGCKCRRLPKKNRGYWRDKFDANRARDKRVARQLRAQGWNVLRFWEHQIKKEPQRVLKRIANMLAATQTHREGV